MEKIKKVLISQTLSIVFIFSFLSIGYCVPDSAYNKQRLRVPMMGFENKDRLSTGTEDEREASMGLKVFKGFEEFVNLREAKDLLERLKGVVDIYKSERFRHMIPLLLAVKEELKNPDEPHKMYDSYYRYPSNCRPCSVHAVRILKKFHFKAELRTVEFPEEIYPDLDIEKHSFVVTEIGGKEFIIDIAADQFEPLGENKWADLGVVVLPVDVVNQYPTRFWMYTGHRVPADSSAELLKQVIPAEIIRTAI